MAADIKHIAKKVDNLTRRFAERDVRMENIRLVRKGKMTSLFSELFPDGQDQAMTANFIDVAAHDLAEVLAPLPSFNCATASINNDTARKFADKRSMIANNYVYNSRLQSQMYKGGDWYFSYGFLPIHVEADWECNMPRIRIEDPIGAYPEFDRFGRCISYTKRYKKTIAELISDFPEHETRILGASGYSADVSSQLEVVYYTDKNWIVLYLPTRNNLVLSEAANPLGKMLVHVAVRPSIDDEPRGQFDDVLFVQLARARFANLAMEAAEKSIQAPLIVPHDVMDVAIGPDAIIRTVEPNAVGRLKLDVPAAAFQEQATLESELRLGARYPEGRTGNIKASIITGQGVEALLGAFDSQIKAGQTILAEAFEDVIKTCFEMDQALFDEQKSARGTAQGTPYELKYKPSKDINGDTSIEVRYGLMAGLDPSRALIFSLQALGANLVSKDFIRRELPWSVNVTLEEQRIEVEKMRDNLSAAITATAQAIPSLVAQGQNPTKIISNIADVIDRRRNGESIEAAALAVFKEEAPEAQAQGQEQMVPPGQQAPVEQATPSQAAPGIPSGGTPQQAPQGGQPDLGTLLAGISAGR